MIRLITFYLLLLFKSACILYAQIPSNEWIQGDIIFQELPCGTLCESISKVTPSKKGFLFTHAGLILKKDDGLYVVEAIGHEVQITSLDKFINRSQKSSSQKMSIAVARFKSKSKAKKSAEAAQLATQYVGVPYDNAFLPDGSALYCTELIQLAYRKVGLHNAIPSQPMTFKDPLTKEILSAWTAYYEALGLKVPEGVLGTNPGRFSLHKGLKFVFPVK